jgi:hypothetical protein
MLRIPIKIANHNVILDYFRRLKHSDEQTLRVNVTRDS